MKTSYPFAQPASADMQLVRDKNPTASILLGVAAIQLVVSLVGWFAHRVNPDMDVPELKWVLYSFQRGAFTWVDWAFALSGAVYIALGVAAWWARVPAALLGAVLYAGLLVLQSFEGADVLRAGLVAKIPTAMLLLVALVIALRRVPAGAQDRSP